MVIIILIARANRHFYLNWSIQWHFFFVGSFGCHSAFFFLSFPSFYYRLSWFDSGPVFCGLRFGVGEGFVYTDIFQLPYGTCIGVTEYIYQSVESRSLTLIT